MSRICAITTGYVGSRVEPPREHGQLGHKSARSTAGESEMSPTHPGAFRARRSSVPSGCIHGLGSGAPPARGVRGLACVVTQSETSDWIPLPGQSSARPRKSRSQDAQRRRPARPARPSGDTDTDATWCSLVGNIEPDPRSAASPLIPARGGAGRTTKPHPIASAGSPILAVGDGLTRRQAASDGLIGGSILSALCIRIEQRSLTFWYADP